MDGARTNLVGSLINLLGVERGTNTASDTGAEEDVVGDGGNTTVVDLGLCHWLIPHNASTSSYSRVRETTNLGERDGVQAVLGGDLEADSITALGVPDGLGRSLDLLVDLVVVAGSEDAQVVCGSDGSTVLGCDVANSGTIAGDSSLLDVVAGGGTSKETLMADNGIHVGSGAL